MAGFGSGANFDLPQGTHVHYINGVSHTETTGFRDKTKIVKQFLWDVQYQEEGSDEWKSRKIWTGQDFLLWESITASHLIPKLMKLVRACGMASPQTQEEAAAWNEEILVGQYFRVKNEPDEESGKLVEKFIPMPGVAPGPGAIGKGGQSKTAATPDRKAAPKPPPPPPPVPAAAAAAVTGTDEYE